MTDACDINNRPPAPDMNPDDEQTTAILAAAKTVAVVGLSDKPHRASFVVGKYLLDHQFDVIPIHPNLTLWEGRPAVSSLADLPNPVDIVDLFRNSQAVGAMVDEIIAAQPKVAWLQLGVVNNDAAKKLRDAGITVVQDRCIKIEHERLF
jgi:hypothetical protein